MDERKRELKPTPLAGMVDKLMKAYRLDGKLKEIDVLSKWEEMMGKAVAIRTKEIYIQHKVLHLHIDSSVMRDELHYGKTIIIQRVNETAEVELITDVWFK